MFTGGYEVPGYKQQLPDCDTNREPDDPNLTDLPHLAHGQTHGPDHGRRDPGIVRPASLLSHLLQHGELRVSHCKVTSLLVLTTITQSEHLQGDRQPLFISAPLLVSGTPL